MQVVDGQMQTLQTDFDNDGTIDEVRTSGGELVVAETPQVDVDTLTPPQSSQSSATRVAERTLVPQVLGLSVSTDTLTTEQLQSLQVLLADVQQVIKENKLTTLDLTTISNVLEKSLLIITN